MKYSVSHWEGRLGNNIQQTANCLMLAESRGHAFNQRLKHDIIGRFSYNFGPFMHRFCRGSHHIKGVFYKWEPIVDCADKGNLLGGNEIGVSKEFVYTNMRRVCRDYIRNHLKVPTLKPLDEDTLVIHIRAGDIFEKENEVPHNYVQNPLSYYLALIKDFKKVIVVVEPDRNNPVVQELQKINRLKFQSLSVAEDYATLLSAKNLATSGVGTFAVSAAFCSHNIKNLFTSNAYLTEHLNCSMLYDTDVTVHEVKLKDYIPVYPPSWKNNAEQRRLMLEYQLPE